MHQNYQLIITLATISLFYSLFYFYIYKLNKHRYIALWGFGWMIYSIGSTFDLFFPTYDLFDIIKNLFSIVSGFFLLIGTFEFIGNRFHKSFFYFSMSVFLVVFGFSFLFYFSAGILAMRLELVASLLLSFISVGTGTVLLIHEENDMDPYFSAQKRETVIDVTAWVFIVWGIHKGFYNFVTPDFETSFWNYTSSILLTNFLNITLILANSAKYNTEIANNERLYRLLAENSKDAIVKINLLPNLNYTYISPAIKTITGYDESAFYSQPSFFTSLISDEDRERYTDYIRNINEIDSKIVFRLYTKDRNQIWIEQHSTILYDENGVPVSIESILRDVSDRMIIEKNLFNSETVRRRLLATISHELKSPITSIIGYLSIINDNLEPDLNTYKRYVQVCLEKSFTLNVLIKDLFELSKLEAKQLAFEYEEIKAADYLKMIYDKYSTDIEQAGGLPRYIDTKPLNNSTIFIDTLRIEQVLNNIIQNSMNHIVPNGEITFYYDCKEGTDCPEVANHREDYIIYAIEDNGSGIPKSELSLIFQRFYRSTSSKSGLGAGLGLAICKEIIQIHNGYIWAESEENKGTTLFVAFPKKAREVEINGK